jgi:hypothetical protein
MRSRPTLIPLGFVLVIYAANKVRFAFAWLRFLWREKRIERRRQRIQEFLAACDAVAARGAPVVRKTNR